MAALRTDDVHAGRPTIQTLQSLERVQRMAVPALDRASVEQLLGDMLGAPAPVEVVGALESVTGGNPFAVADQVLAALSDGRLQRQPGGHWTLRGGWQVGVGDTRCVLTRLERCSPRARRCAEIIAIVGRAVPIESLVTLLGSPEVAFAALRELFSQRLIFEAEAGAVRLVHSRIGEAIETNLTPTLRRRLHRQVAELLGAAGLGLGGIAFHWDRGGEQRSARAAYAKAAVSALSIGAYRDAVRLGEEALRCDAGLGRHARMGRQDRGRLLMTIAEGHLGLGEHHPARGALASAAAALGVPVPNGELAITRSLALELPKQVAHRVGLRPASPSPARALEARWQAHLYSRVAEIDWFLARPVSMFQAAVRALNLAESGLPSVELLRTSAVACMAAAALGWERLAAIYERQTRALMARLPGERARAYGHFILGLRHVAPGDWDRATEGLTLGRDGFERVGVSRLAGDAATLLAMIGLYRGDMPRGEFADILVRGQAHENVQHQVWGHLGLATIALREGDPRASKNHAREARDLAAAAGDLVERLRAEAARAIATLHLGRPQDAASEAKRLVATIVSQISPLSHHVLELYSAPIEIALAVRDHDLARRALAAMRAYGRVVPIARPRLALLSAMYHRQRGERRRARWQARRGLAIARRLTLEPETRWLRQLRDDDTLPLLLMT